MFKRKLPTPIVMLMLIAVAAALATWCMPAGQYDTISYENGAFFLHKRNDIIKLPFGQRVLDSLHILIKAEKFSQGDIRKAVSVPGSYHRLAQNGQTPVDLIQAPVKGLYDGVEIIVFILVIGGFMNIFNQSGAMEKGLVTLSKKMNGKENRLIIILCFLFSFAGASYGMAEEALVFYPVMMPLFLAAGYDALIPVGVIFGGTQLGTLASFSNPFSTIIASQVAGVNWTDGLSGRVLMFVLSTLITIIYFVNYAKKIKKDPTASFVYRIDGIRPQTLQQANAGTADGKLDNKSKWLLVIFLASFLVMITGVVYFGWWMVQMSALFLTSSILVAFILRMKEKIFIEKFIQGAESLLGVSFIVGVARGVTILLNDGYISDTIVHFAAGLVSHLPPTLFILILLGLFIFFTLFISSSSGMAVVTMPIMGSLALVAGVPGREIVNAYLYGMGIMGFITPTGLILPSLALTKVSYKAWVRFISPLMLILFLLCCLFLVIGIRL